MTDAYPSRLVELLNPPSGVVALAAQHVESGRTWRHNEHRALPSASLIKLPILAAFWQAVEAGRLDPAERVSVPAEARARRARGCSRRSRPVCSRPGVTSPR